MNERSQSLLKIRPHLSSVKISAEMSSDERFQNLTLRPVIKLQNALLLAAFQNYIRKHKGRFYELSPQERISYIENAIQKDVKFRNSLKGMVIGHFTEEEYQRYIQNSSALNKRMMNMVTERLKDQIQVFTETVLA